MPTNLWRDDRAIEGLPIRLVVALVVGIACLAVMMSVIGGLNTFESTELDTDPAPEVITEGNATVEVAVLDPAGNPVQNATVVATGDSARLSSGVQTAKTDENGTAVFDRVEAELQPNQETGTVALEIRPPSDGDYTDDRENTDILVLGS
jgi:FlaG/FlaF family flagellin (archaellin)